MADLRSAFSGESAFILVAALVIASPIVIGCALGHIPRKTAGMVLVPTILFSVLSILGERALRLQQRGFAQLAVSLVFGAFWIVFSLAVHPKEGAHLRKFRWMFLLFGITWIAITLYQYATPNS